MKAADGAVEALELARLPMIARINLPVGLLMLVMIVPILVRLDFLALRKTKGMCTGIHGCVPARSKMESWF